MFCSSIRVVVLAILVSSLDLVLAQREPTSHVGTTRDIQEVYNGRCWDYDVTRYKGLLPRVETSCDELWTSFEKGFRFKKPCDVSTAGYLDFLSAAVQQLPENKVMFWSGVYALAHRYSNAARNFITLEDTMIGYLVNDLVWCGQQSAPGINYDKCPEWSDCELEASESFWAGASTMYSKMATGAVTLMLGGSDPNRPAYRRDSFFGKHELPSLSTTLVTKVQAIVTHVLGQPHLETCSNGSLLDLKVDVEARGFEFECIDDPDSVMHLLCAENPDAEECKLALSHAKGELQYPTADHKKKVLNSAPIDHFNN